MHKILAVLLPATCVLCGDRAIEPFNLCSGCLGDLPGMHAACRRCAIPLPYPDTCAQCTMNPPVFRHAFAAFRYLDPINTLIQQLKFQRALAIAPTLGHLLRIRVKQAGVLDSECILPVPLHPRRLRQRGFNQSMEVARIVAAGTNIPLRPFWVRRNRDTPAQSGMHNVRARHRNVRGAFSASIRLARYRRVAIVDDVVTTGATAAELARTILAQGVESVDLWCVARAERGHIRSTL